MSLILQEREIKGSVSVSNNEDKYLYFHNFWTSLFMALSQIMRSLLRQEHTDVIKFPTRLVRAWKNSSKRKDGLMVLPLSKGLAQLGEVLASAMYFQCDLA